MDKNTVIGFLLIAAILIGFTWLNKPSEEQLAQQQKYNDSIALVEAQQQKMEQAKDSAKQLMAASDSTKLKNDSAFQAMKADVYGDFSVASVGEEKFYTLENDLIKLVLSNKGGRVYSVQLKKYKGQNDKPLILFEKDESYFNYVLVTLNNRVVNTSDMYFEPVGAVQKDAKGNQTFTLRLKTKYSDAYIDFIYRLPANDYMVKYDMKATNMNKVMPMSVNSLTLNWNTVVRQQEKGRSFEARYSTLSYRFVAGDMESMNAAKNDTKTINNQIKWIDFKDQFFSSILIADKSFTSASLSSEVMDAATGYLKSYKSELSVPFDITGKETTGFKMYFGPNHYKTLASYDKNVPDDDKLHLQELIPLGWTIFGWVNRFFVIPVFNFLSKYIGSFGIIILLLTIIIKSILAPLSYKSYMSSAKMRVLKPQIDEINARIPAEKAMERQKATMDLYNKVGISPMSGCLPMLLQMPLLIAMFSFFPAAIELRQQSFLWANDLSAYDAIISWQANIPMISRLFDNHISLFALLMTIASIFSTRMSMANTTTSPDQPGAGMMKWMMYLMPIFFFFMFNSYASGLTYYYFLSSLFTILQNEIIRLSINDEKLLAQLHAKGNTKNGKPKKKSSFMERLEKMQREQEKAMRENAKRKR